MTDTFGDNGLISVIIGRREGVDLHLDLWIMSCRVLKRYVEIAMLDTLVDHARAAGVERIVGYYLPTPNWEQRLERGGLRLPGSRQLSDGYRKALQLRALRSVFPSTPTLYQRLAASGIAAALFFKSSAELAQSFQRTRFITLATAALVWVAFFFMNAAQPKGFVYFAF